MGSRFTRRSQQIEIMDNLQCSGDEVYQTLRELEFINRWLGGNAVTLEGIKQLTKNNENKQLTIADLGCGGGDMLKMVADWGRKNKFTLQLTGIDANPHIVDFARDNCKAYPEITFEILDIFSIDFQEKKYDIILGTLFYHHFQSGTLINFFEKLKGQARIGLVINDIHRHWFAYHSIRLLTKFFSKSPMVKFDAPTSVLRAFTKNELINILIKAGIHRYQLRWRWAFRWQVVCPMADHSTFS